MVTENDNKTQDHESAPSTSASLPQAAPEYPNNVRLERASPSSRSSNSSKSSTPVNVPEIERIPMRLVSPVGGEAFTFSWPLRETFGYSEGQEILDVIRNALCSFQELNFVIRSQFDLDKIDKRDYNEMKRLFDVFNKTATTVSQLWKGATKPGGEMWSAERADPNLLKQICARAYNRAVDNVHLLNNHYKAFSSETYGETSFERLQLIIQEILPKERDVFVDLGSGVGQLVIQMAGASRIKKAIGIEVAALPNKYAENLAVEFRKWMKWYGKKFRPFELCKGDFLDEKFRDLITKEATIIFINNFAFTAELESRIKRGLLSELKDGTRIISTRSYGHSNRTITDRNLNDISAILDVYEMSECENACSWTSNYVPYFHHTINRSKLEKYFLSQRNPALKGGSNGSDGSRRSSLSSKGSRDARWSRESSVSTPKRCGTPILHGGTPSTTRVNTPSTLTKTTVEHHSDDDDHTTGPTTRRKWHEYCSELDKKRKRERDKSNEGMSTVTVVNENGPSDTIRKWPTPDTDYVPPSLKKNRKLGQGRGRPRKVTAPSKASPEKTKEAINLMHQMTRTVTARPASPLHDPSLVLADLTSQKYLSPTSGDVVPAVMDENSVKSKYPGLDDLMDNMRSMFERYLEQMKLPDYGTLIAKEIEIQKFNKASILSKMDGLNKQILQLKTNGVHFLHQRLEEVGITANTPSNLLENAKEIVARHKLIQAECAALESEITALDLSNQQLEMKLRRRDEAIISSTAGMPGTVPIPLLSSIYASNIAENYRVLDDQKKNILNSVNLFTNQGDSLICSDQPTSLAASENLCPPPSEAMSGLSYSSASMSYNGTPGQTVTGAITNVVSSSRRTRHRPPRNGPTNKRLLSNSGKLPSDPKEDAEMERKIQDIVAKALEVDSAAKCAEKERRARGDKRKEKPVTPVTRRCDDATVMTVTTSAGLMSPTMRNTTPESAGSGMITACISSGPTASLAAPITVVPSKSPETDSAKSDDD